MSGKIARPRILVLTSYYLPGYLSGGPLRSIANLVECLGDEFEWSILTSDHDLGVPAPYPEVRSDQWNTVGKSRVFYAGANTRAPNGLLRVIRETPHDVLYLNSFFDPRFAVVPSLAMHLRLTPRAPLLIAPRGEFSDGAVELKAWKKRPYIGISRLAGVYDRAHWHASTPLEADDIRRELRVDPIHIHSASDLALPQRPRAPSAAPPPSDPEALKVCFLSRISRKKNLDYALRILSQTRRRIDFSIYGPREDAEYWNECEALLEGLPSNVRAKYEGPVRAEDVGSVFAQHDLFFMPTRGENFGHVFVEAWSAGTPVLTSDQTPWRGLADQGVGWDVPLEDADGFLRALESAVKQGTDARDRAAEQCLTFVERHVRDEVAIEDNRRMFRSVASGGSTP